MRDRFNPKVISTARTPGTTASIKFREGYVYLTDVEAGLYLIDVRNRLHPEFVAHQSINGNAMGVSLFTPDDRTAIAYIAGEGGGWHAVDVSQPSNPQWMHRYDASGEANGLDVIHGEDGRRMA